MVNKISLLERMSQAGKPHKLSGRQVQILVLLAEGYKQAYVAEMLGISPKTVCAHTDAAYRRLKVHNIAHAIAFLLSN